MQKCTSKNTSINKTKLPAISKLIDWKVYSNQKILDYGGGKYDNFKDWLKENYNIDLLIYDKYNRSEKDNKDALRETYTLVICSNVLNVIDNDAEILDTLACIRRLARLAVFTVYEGDRSGVGKYTKKDCYQRNAKINDYARFFWRYPIVTKNMIVSYGIGF